MKQGISLVWRLLSLTQPFAPPLTHIFEGGSGIFTVIFAHKGSGYDNYRFMSMHICGILPVEWLKLIDAPSTLHCCSIDAPLKLHWRSIDARILDIVVILSQAFWLWNLADSSIIGQCSSTSPGLSMLQGQDSWTFCWHWFLGHSSGVVTSILLQKGGR